MEDRSAFRAWAVLIDAATDCDGVVGSGASDLVKAYVNGLITLDELHDQAPVHLKSGQHPSSS